MLCRKPRILAHHDTEGGRLTTSRYYARAEHAVRAITARRTSPRHSSPPPNRVEAGKAYFSFSDPSLMTPRATRRDTDFDRLRAPPLHSMTPPLPNGLAPLKNCTALCLRTDDCARPATYFL